MNSSSFSANGAFLGRSPLSEPRSRLQSKQVASIQQREHHVLQVLATANRSLGKRNPNDEVIMVDPLEAKQLAAKQMQEIKAKEKLKRQRRIEAINGAWAMIGLTAGLVIEGNTGNSILEQGGAERGKEIWGRCTFHIGALKALQLYNLLREANSQFNTINLP